MATESNEPSGLVEAKETTPETPSSKQSESLPDELLKIPVIQALTVGAPAAVSTEIATFSKTPEAKLITAHKKGLMTAGFGFYRSLDGQLGVMFNQLYVSGESIKQADQAGALLEVAPLDTNVKNALQTAGAQNQEQQAAPPPMAPVASAAPPANRKVMEQRAMSLTPQSPLEGSKPGAGRLLNDILRPIL